MEYPVKCLFRWLGSTYSHSIRTFNHFSWQVSNLKGLLQAIIVWHWQKRTPRRLLYEHMNQWTALALSNNNKFIVSCAFEYNLKIWNLDEVEDPKIFTLAISLWRWLLLETSLTWLLVAHRGNNYLQDAKCEVISNQNLDSGIIQCILYWLLIIRT